MRTLLHKRLCLPQSQNDGPLTQRQKRTCCHLDWQASESVRENYVTAHANCLAI